MQAVRASTSAGSIAGNMPDAQLVAAELAVRLGVDDAVGAQHRRHRGGVDRRRGRWCPPRSERMASSVTNGVAYGRLLGPAVEDDRPTAASRATHRVEPAEADHPLELLVEQEQRGERRRVVGLVEAAVVERDLQVERGRDPAARRVDPLDAVDGGGRAQRDPQPAVGGEALLRGEVVDVDLGRVPRQPAGAGGGVDRRGGRRPRPGRASGIMTPVDVSLWVRA